MPIPVSQIVTVNPAVVGTGGNPLSLNAVLLDAGVTTPVSSLLSFPDQASVGDYYGLNSTQYALAGIYFNGPSNSLKKPGTLFFGGYASADRAAWLRGQRLSITLAQLKAVTGSLSVTIDGVAHSYPTVDLSTATSFTDAASKLTTGLGLTGAAAVTWDAAASRFQITSGTTGVASTITQATGTAAAALGLSAGTLSQGVATDTPATAMARIAVQSYNWATFTTIFEASDEEMVGFAEWANTQNKGYCYVAWDKDTAYKTPNSSTFGSTVDTLNYDGTLVIYGDDTHAVAACSWAGSIDWQAVNGRSTLAFRQFSGVQAFVDNYADAAAVLTNNASYYGSYVDRGEGNEYSIMYNGQMKGSTFLWADSFMAQLYLNAQLRLSMFEGLLSVNSAPYNALGNSLIRAWCQDPIDEALNNGTIRTGVQLSNSQKATIAQQAGLDISSDLQSKGYYLQILPATAQVRGQRQSPPVKLWYTDGGSIQQITLASIAVL
ncbi:MAG: DUF3383 domain-containing protein [Pseudomonas sp.]